MSNIGKRKPIKVALSKMNLRTNEVPVKMVILQTMVALFSVQNPRSKIMYNYLSARRMRIRA